MLTLSEINDAKDEIRDRLNERRLKTMDELKGQTITNSAINGGRPRLFLAFESGQWATFTADCADDWTSIELDTFPYWESHEMWDELVELGLVEEADQAMYKQIKAEEVAYHQQGHREYRLKELRRLMSEFPDEVENIALELWPNAQ